MKRHNIIKFILITLAVFLVFSWIFPSAYFQTSYIEQGRIQMGLFDIASYPVTTLSYFGYIAIYVLVVGGLYGVLNHIGAYRVLLDKMVKAFKGSEKIVLSVIMILLAIIVSFCGLQYALLLVFPFIISLVLMMGYNKVVAALTTVGSVMVGMIGSTFAYNNTSILSSYLSLKVTENIVYNIIILVLGLAILIAYTMWYINRKLPKNSKSKAIELEEFVPASVSAKESSGVRVWPVALFSILLLVVMILSFTSWGAVFNVNIFDEFVNTTLATLAMPVYAVLLCIFGITNIVILIKLLVKGHEGEGRYKGLAKANIVLISAFVLSAIIGSLSIKGGFVSWLKTDVNIFAKILGNVLPFGSWTLTELSLCAIIFMLIIAGIYKVKLDDLIEHFLDGIKRAIEPAIIVLLIYTGLVIVTYHPFQLSIYKAIFGMTKGFNVFTTSIVAILSSLFNADPLYTFNSAVPYLMSLVTDTSVYPAIWMIFQGVYGVTMLAAPTSLVLMLTLSYLHIPYQSWLKRTWIVSVALLFLVLIVSLIVVLV
ncbi:MAG: hypothetical protein J6B89_02555 [Bacilli bacterium]|nr:hypothetical protein [Bacilli bacterium]